MQLRNTYICEPVRTPVGRFGGAYKDLSAQFLGAAVLKGLLDKTKLPPSAVDDVLFAQCYPSMDAPALGRVVALDAGLPIAAGGLQLDRRCGSGLQTLIYGILQVATGASDLVITGGAESMSNAPFYTTRARWGIKAPALAFSDSLAKGRVSAGGVNFPVPGGMLETAENLRNDYQVSRAEQDGFAAESQRRALDAQARGVFDDEIIPVSVPSRKGETVVVADETPRQTTVEALAELKPIRLREDPDATVTAGNASTQNDGASACIVATEAMVAEYGLRPFARLVSWSVAGVEPSRMGIGPVPAVEKALAQAQLSLSEIDLIEVNEAFAAQVLACTKAWNFAQSDFDRLNVNGSGISLGHPVGATGGRILATLLREMQRRQVNYGVETMCIGGGQGLAAVFERL
ncbi:acetyl-CoA C-acetyltransferase [Pseudomonadales bacterium]|jgi:acetyl-CoA C-acetyltransferase|nr:acetyl-CoA C-acetyltransferase [Pseudomonadales bacterium]